MPINEETKTEIVTILDVCDYIPIDELDESIKKNVKRLIGTADRYLQGAIGKNYPKEDERAQTCALLIIKELYLNSSNVDSINKNVKKLINDFCNQIKLEMRINNDKR